MEKAFRGCLPDSRSAAFAAENAALIGRVFLAPGSSVWYGAVLRGDDGPIRIGENSNVQDLACLHPGGGKPVEIGSGVSIGHGAVVHGCTVENDVVVGMHATLLNGCVIGQGSIIAAGALVPEGRIVPPGSLVMGVPGRVLRPVTAEELAANRRTAQRYVALAKEAAKESAR